ncbi:hypothetical protein JCM10450v2_004460 [Rhodotorula kratochvilovae]
MKAATELIISLSTVFGTIFVALALAGARFAYRRSKRSRSKPVDPVYEETKVTLAGAEDAGSLANAKEAQERWFAGAWGVTPVASAGPGGTAQYLGGWWGLDAPSKAGWSRSSTSDSSPPSYDAAPPSEGYGSTRSTSASTMRESHFSRASRASRRAEKLLRAASSSSSKKEKKKPRVSKTSEFGAMEREVEVDAAAGEGEEREAEKRGRGGGEEKERLVRE